MTDNHSAVSRRDFAALSGMAALGALVPSRYPDSLGIPGAPGTALDPDDQIPQFTFAMEGQKGKETAGGVAREATVKELPISEGLAGVSMRLKPGGLRELHWHALAAEWAFMITGHCRVSVFDPDGHTEVVDLAPGDIWYFPRGYGHSLQGLGPDETHFVLIFDNGHFSEFGTFSVSDWLSLTPPAVLAQNFGVPADAFAHIPRHEVYIAAGKVPPPLPDEPAPGTDRSGALTHKYRLMAQPPKQFPGGTLRIASSVEFPISKTMTGAYMTLQPGALRALHWHPNADEWQYYISGRVRVTIFGSGGRARTEEVGPGTAVYIPRGYGHHIESIGSEEAKVIIAFNAGTYQESSLTEWLAAVPSQIVRDNFAVPDSATPSFQHPGPAIVSAR